MPSNIFATTGTNVSILFLNDVNDGDVVLVDASKLGTEVKDGKNQKILLSREEEDRIIETFNAKEAVDDFSVAVSYDEIEAKNYSLSAGQYFEVKIEYVDISPEEFQAKLAGHQERLTSLFGESSHLEKEIQSQLKGLKLRPKNTYSEPTRVGERLRCGYACHNGYRRCATNPTCEKTNLNHH